MHEVYNFFVTLHYTMRLRRQGAVRCVMVLVFGYFYCVRTGDN